MSEDIPVEYPIDGTLDLHMFHPHDVKNLVQDYIQECYMLNIYELRIIHGKGTGALRETVHSILKKHELVKSFRLAGGDAGSWGATLVELKPGE